MKAIILSAGKGTRLAPLTDTIPKTLIKVLGKSLLEYNLELVYEHVDEIYIVVKYLKEQIIEEFGNEYRGTKITYIEQGDKAGTGGAILGIDFDGDMLILYGDGILDKMDIDAVLRQKNYCSLAVKVSNPSIYGIYRTDSEGKAIEIVEKPSEYIGDLANIGGYKVNSDIFRYMQSIPANVRGEYEITDAINMFIKNNPYEIVEIKGDWIDVGKIEDIERAENILKNTLLAKPNFLDATRLSRIGEYDLFLGVKEEWAKTIIELSNDENDISLRDNTSDAKRFSDFSHLNTWYNDDGRYVFSLVKDNEIAGLWFARPSQLPNIVSIIDKKIMEEVINNEDNLHTNAIRIYPKFRGKGLAVPMILQSIYFYEKIYPKALHIIDIDKGNIASQKTYEKMGYRFFATGENKKSVPGQIEERLIYALIPEN